MGGIAVYVALIMLFLWLPKDMRVAVAKFGFFTDITVHLILQGLLGGDGYGRMSMLFGGVAFNITLMLYRKFRVENKT